MSTKKQTHLPVFLQWNHSQAVSSLHLNERTRSHQRKDLLVGQDVHTLENSLGHFLISLLVEV